MQIEVVSRESTVGACARAIRTAILSGEIGAGEKLPPERELASRFGVNRVTVRSALAQLEARRLLSVRQGSGYVVRSWRREGGPDLLPAVGSLAGEGKALVAVARDLLLVRRQLARAVLERLVESADARDIVAAGAAIEAFARVAARGGSSSELAAADVDVVAALLEATHSPVLQLCLNPIVAVLAELPALRDAIYRDPARNVRGWQALVAWLPARRRDLVDGIAAILADNDEATLSALSAPRRKAAPRKTGENR
jgi:DNA-binding FadR family transcriptional regulator